MTREMEGKALNEWWSKQCHDIREERDLIVVQRDAVSAALVLACKRLAASNGRIWQEVMEDILREVRG